MDNSNFDYIHGAIEALLFINEKPVMIEQIKDAVKGVSVQDIKQVIGTLKDEYDKSKRGMVIVEIAGGYQMLSNPYYADYIRNFYKKRVKEKLSRPALETLSIIAYKQPVSRADIEMIRGVNSDGVVTHLLDKGLIKIVGRKDVPGRPYLHGTTKLFLEYFGLRSLADMPKIEDFLNTPTSDDASEQTADTPSEQQQQSDAENQKTDPQEEQSKEQETEVPDMASSQNTEAIQVESDKTS